MPIRQSIAIKIFGLASVLLLLTVALAVYLLKQADASRQDMELVVHRDLPLTESATRINEYGLRRRLAFERWFGALNISPPNQEVVAEASANYALFTERLGSEFQLAFQLLDRHTAGEAHQSELQEVRLLLQQIEPTYTLISRRQKELLELQRAGQHEKANQLLNVVNDIMRQIRDQRSLVQKKMTALTAATALASEQRQQTVQKLAWALTASTILLGLALAALITHRLTQPVRSLVSALHEVQGGNLEIQVPVVSRDEVGLLSDSFNYFVRELRAKEQIKRMFGKYIDPRVVEHLLLQSGAGGFAGDRRMMTVVFADLVGFTALSERLTPSLMVAVLNRHFGLQAQAIQANHGVVDKFIGDSVMAFFGPPFVQEAEHPGLACRAALTQLQALDDLRRELPEITGLRKDGPALDLRLGVATGDVVVGNIGSDNTRSYTVIGDTVNLAARIESANRIYGTRMLVGEATAGLVEKEFELREIDTIAVKGKTEGTSVFELLSPVGQLSPAMREVRESYAGGLRAYRAQDWEVAEKRFRQVLEIQPDDGPAQVMLDRLATLRLSPPSENWNAVFVLKEK